MGRNSSNIDTLRGKFCGKNTKYNLYFNRYFYYLLGLAVTRFKWKNLPPEIDPRFLEEMLFFRGNGIFFKDDIANMFAVMNVTTAGNMDIYGYGDMRFAYSINYNAELTKENSVLLHDNMTDYPSADIIAMHADALSNMRISRDVNLIANRTPVLLTSTCEQKLSAMNIMKQIIDGIPFIHLKKGVRDNGDLKSVRTEAPVLFPELDAAMRWEMSDACTFLGINSFYSDKKERSVSGEVDGNTGELEMNRKNALGVRQRSAEQINKLFGLNITVEFNSDIPLLNNVSAERDSEVE